ncbi:hypothetical protein TNCV_2018851 [Trichonephila clavipes]|nr:hypothetical protein TNCV_2018851 [Trichonephila clavipes]
MIHCHDLEHNGRLRHLTGPSPSPDSFDTQSTPQRNGALHRQVPVRVGGRRLRRFPQGLRPEVQEQMFRSFGHSNAKPPVLSY